MGLALGVVEGERGSSTTRLGVILLLNPKMGLTANVFLLSKTPECVAGTVQTLCNVEKLLPRDAGAGPNPAPPLQQTDTGSVPIYIQDLVGLVDDVKSPDIALFLHLCSQSRTSLSCRGSCPGSPGQSAPHPGASRGVGTGAERMGL